MVEAFWYDRKPKLLFICTKGCFSPQFNQLYHQAKHAKLVMESHTPSSTVPVSATPGQPQPKNTRENSENKQLLRFKLLATRTSLMKSHTGLAPEMWMIPLRSRSMLQTYPLIGHSVDIKLITSVILYCSACTQAALVLHKNGSNVTD